MKHVLTDGGVGHDQHDVRVGRKHIDKSNEARPANLHTHKLCLRLAIIVVFSSMKFQNGKLIVPPTNHLTLRLPSLSSQEHGLPASELELLDNVGYLLEPMFVLVFEISRFGDNEEGGALK